MKKTTALALSAALITISACSPVRDTHGNFLKPHAINSVQTNIDTKTEIIQKLGSPTTIAPFDENVWYYLGQKTVKKGIFDAQVEEERVVQVRFNDEGFVTAVNEVDQDRINIPLSEEKTHTGGNDVTILQQLLGNRGKFNTPHEVPR